MTLRVMIAVTHLLGAGHLTRAAALARAFKASGHAVTLASGGMPAPLVSAAGIDLVQLPPVRTTGTDFTKLLDEVGRPVDAARLAARGAQLTQALRALKPHVLITELFPFGRRVLAAEFLALVEAARTLRPRPLIAASIRDILVCPSKPARIAEAHARLATLYDIVFVHGDPDLVPLEASWPLDAHTKTLMRYTGYVDEGTAVARAPRRAGIVVSGGSSAAGLPLYRAAVGAARTMPDHGWRILVGNGVARDDLAALRESAPAHVTVERARPDFRRLLGEAALSVSQAGYNTVVDALQSGVPTVLVPFEAGHETEQRVRAERLKARGLASLIPDAELTPDRLAHAVRTALAQGRPAATVRLDGAQRTVALTEDLARRPPARAGGLAWQRLDEAVARSADAGRPVRLWWRDDDAVAATPRLDRLLRLSAATRMPLAIAAIPARIEPSLPARLDEERAVRVLVHGFTHENHAPAGEKKAELGPHRAVDVMAKDCARALELARTAFGWRLLPVLVPPWNRIAPDLATALAGLGYLGLSTFVGTSRHLPVPGLARVDTHVDPIDWRGTRSALDPAAVLGRLADVIEAQIGGAADDAGPVGLLTHHLVHDEAVWHLCESLLDRLAGRRHVEIPPADDIFPAAPGVAKKP